MLFPFLEYFSVPLVNSYSCVKILVGSTDEESELSRDWGEEEKRGPSSMCYSEWGTPACACLPLPCRDVALVWLDLPIFQGKPEKMDFM